MPGQLDYLTGATASTIYTAPIGSGINVPLGTTFSKLLNFVVSSFSSTPQATFGGGLQQVSGGNGGIGSALQAYRNAQGGFLGVAENHNRNLKAQALAPGAVVLDSPDSLMPQSIPPAFNQGFFAPNQLAAFNPLQGSTYQNSPRFGSPQGTFATPFAQGQYPMAPYGMNQGGFGKIQFLLMPLIGLFSLVKSLFGLRSFLSTMRPMRIDRDQLGYNQSRESYNNFEKQEGSFDEYEPDEREHQNFNIEQGLQGY